jgi:hypothetical protein
MIDFRYHVVSLVSVFLALAVGIVLGAGPLKESIGTTLTKEVDSLRQDKRTLRTELDTADAGLQHRDDFTTAVMPTLVSGQLVGRRVAIVTLPGVATKVSDPVVDAVTAAGGTVTGRVSIGGAWIDPDKANVRAQTVNDLTVKLPTGTVATTGDTDTRLANLLADALVTTGGGTVGRSASASSTILDGLKSADLIGIKGDVAGLAGAALVLAPGNPESNDNQADPTPPDQPQSEYVDLATALDTVGGGAVVSGPASSANGGGLLAAIRQDDAVKSRISTVDTGATPMGVITAVLALREQLSGGSGAYGFGSGVAEPLPALAASVATTSSSATKK